MKRAHRLLAIPLVLSAAGSQAEAGNDNGGLRCEIRTVETAGGIDLQAVAIASNASGEYELEVEKSGGGGTSSTSQSGDFEISGNRESVLSEVSIGGGGSLYAKLTIWSAAGQVICTAEFPSDI